MSPTIKYIRILELDVSANFIYLLTDLMRTQWQAKLLKAYRSQLLITIINRKKTSLCRQLSTYWTTCH